jgi:outer membrane biosynthesis protein TonB
MSRNSTSRALRPFPVVLALWSLLVFVPGCSPSTPDLSASAAQELQSRLPAVRQAAGAEDYAGALQLLAELEADLEQHAGEGGMSFARYQSISLAIEAVRADLTDLAAAAASSPPTSEPVAPAVSPVPAPYVPAQEPVPPAPAPAPAPIPDPEPEPVPESPEQPAPGNGDQGNENGDQENKKNPPKDKGKP